jgi:hypothetical protein
MLEGSGRGSWRRAMPGIPRRLATENDTQELKECMDEHISLAPFPACSCQLPQASSTSLSDYG